jgi:acylpyruvate hydrolase
VCELREAAAEALKDAQPQVLGIVAEQVARLAIGDEPSLVGDLLLELAGRPAGVAGVHPALVDVRGDLRRRTVVGAHEPERAVDLELVLDGGEEVGEHDEPIRLDRASLVDEAIARQFSDRRRNLGDFEARRAVEDQAECARLVVGGQQHDGSAEGTLTEPRMRDEELASEVFHPGRAGRRYSSEVRDFAARPQRPCRRWFSRRSVTICAAMYVTRMPTRSGKPTNQTPIWPMRSQVVCSTAMITPRSLSRPAEHCLDGAKVLSCCAIRACGWDNAQMRLATVLPPGMQQPVAAQVVDGLAVAFPSNWTVEQLLSLDLEDRPPPSRAAWPIRDVELLAPVPRPGAIFGVGRNYADHARELGNAVPDAPTVFAKLSRSSTGPAGPVRLPRRAQFVDYEGELVVVMGARGNVAGYAIANDVSARDLQFDSDSGQWTRGKGADTFCPWGPWITTAEEVPDIRDLRLRTYVNGELRQDATTADLIFGIDTLIAHIEEVSRLEPGDLILTGTPAGVGYGRDPKVPLAPGDRVRIEIDLLGAIEHGIE